MVVPIGKVDPRDGTQVTVGLVSHVSDAVGFVKLTVAPSALMHCTETFAGQVIVGAIVSPTVTVKVHGGETLAGTA